MTAPASSHSNSARSINARALWRNDTARFRRQHRRMYSTQGLHRSVQQRPDGVATICADRIRTFREQADRVARLAGALRTLGVRDGERVGILSLNSDRYAEVLLAVPWANGVVNPINIRWSDSEIIYGLKDSETTVLFVDDTFAPRVGALRDDCDGLETVVHAGDGPTPTGTLAHEELATQTDPIDDARRGGSAIHGLYYTGGTTGVPKGVMQSHDSMCAAALTVEATVPSGLGDAVMLIASAMSHMAGLFNSMLAATYGATQVMVPIFAPDVVGAAIERHRATHAFFVPTMLQMLLDHPETARRDLTSMRRIIYGASPITEVLLRRAMAAFPHASFQQVYAATEFVAASFLGPREHRDGQHLRSAGRATVSTELRIVDDADNVVPPGTVGEIVGRGASTMLGYWNSPDASAEALRGGWLHTGDAGYLDKDGYLHVVDRVKDMIITGGNNVYSTEVENAIATHPSVAACAVIGVPDEAWGERVHAVLVPKQGAVVDIEEIRQHCKERIAAYKAPKSCEIVDEIPLSPIGKPLKRQLRKPYWEGLDRAVH
jgi:acyl-CoA synthetase (AMP-forming)/AMP-acid ligase II